MAVRVHAVDDGYVVVGGWEGCAATNAFLAHLAGRAFSAATVRAYAFDVLNLARFLIDRDLGLAAVTPVTVFEWIDWQGVRRDPRPGAAPRNGRQRTTAASTINRRVAAVRALFDAGAGRTISTAVIQSTVLSLRNLLDDITAWGWEQAPARRLVFAADVPKLDQPLPRALAPDVDAMVMNSVALLEDPFARIGLTVLRGAGLRVGELLDLELGSVVDYGPAGTWLKVPLGKLATERMVPLSAATVAALDEWTSGRGVCRPLPHPRTGALTDFLFVAHGRRLSQTRLRNGLLAAVERSGLRGAAGAPLIVTPHQLRHTWATELANAGMSLQALMALLGHVTPQMTIRYATLASPTLRAAYDQAMGKVRRRFTLTPVGKPIVPDAVSWLGSEMLKTRVAHGYCSRHEAAGACPYANICETCDNFVTGPEFRDALEAQRTDIQALETDARDRGWPDEAARHHRVADALTDHLHRLDR
ncbi:tyrosine-type recombinase/integrase (plasmid) [Rhodococcus pseudokoreensis]|uniref:Tyrosine-type recombinase/integrase n=1 Tax=Rhodococcus pseudokoreensis TaxID=2811421 RepID=A0A974ZRM5_9NOCA|nr:tyrosine-type recombinase/integrase [Rhodococcus pseudokoreensis]QSE87805.1 tyrosine-type recombinase/integrase [Rhodococcus pseudokoreensis]